MNSLSKVTVLVTLLSVPFAGFAMDLDNTWSVPALESVVETTAQVVTEAPQVVAVATDAAAQGKLETLKELGSKAVEGAKALGSAIVSRVPSVSLPKFAQIQLPQISFDGQTAGKAVGVVVLTGMAAILAKTIYDVARAPKAIKPASVNPQDTTQEPAVQQEPAQQEPAKQEPAKTEAPKVTVAASKDVESVVVVKTTKEEESVVVEKTEAPKAEQSVKVDEKALAMAAKVQKAFETGNYSNTFAQLATATNAKDQQALITKRNLPFNLAEYKAWFGLVK